MPTTSNLNPVPGVAVPNLAIIRLGPAGDVIFYNNAGSVHLLADVVGYFRDGRRSGWRRWRRARLLDTRDGTGGHPGVLGAGQTLDLQVADRGGVSGDPEAVALNVTVTEPDGSQLPDGVAVWRGHALRVERQHGARPDRAQHGDDPGRRQRHGQHLQQRRLHRCHRRRARLLRRRRQRPLRGPQPEPGARHPKWHRCSARARSGRHRWRSSCSAGEASRPGRQRRDDERHRCRADRRTHS